MAALTTRGTGSGFTVKKFANVDQSVEVSDCILELQKAGNEVSNGKLVRLEQMLTSQAIALDTIFNRLALKAAGSDHLKNYEVFMRLAFKAQAQSRCTVEALAALKNPKPFISQTNIGQVGHNQVNNTYAQPSSNTRLLMQSSDEDPLLTPNKLLKQQQPAMLERVLSQQFQDGA